MSRTLVLLAHPDLASSRINRHLAGAARDVPGVTVRDLAAVRGAAGFDVAAEQQLLVDHDSIVLQFPWFWYSVPAVLKEWLDEVLTYGFAYGTDGTALHGKLLRVVTSTGGPLESYGPEGFNRFTMDELMRPLDATAHLCGMRLEEPFIVHGARVLDDEVLATCADDYRALLNKEERPALAS